MQRSDHAVKTQRVTEADGRAGPPIADGSQGDSVLGDRGTLSVASLVLVGPERWRVAVERLIVGNRNLAVAANVVSDPREIDIDDISQRDVVLIAVDGEHPDYPIELAVQVEAKDRGTGIALVLPNMSNKHLRSFHARGGNWSLISAAACGDQALLSAILESAGRGIPWVDPIITRLFKSFELDAADLHDGAMSDPVQNAEPVAESTGQLKESSAARILVADDSDDVRLALQTLLEGAGHEVMEAGNGEEAVGLAQAFMPDLILLDVMMPKVDGFKALGLLKADPATKNIPVIMVTARGGRNDEETARGLGAFDYLHKPWSDGEVEMIVNWALTRQRGAR